MENVMLDKPEIFARPDGGFGCNYGGKVLKSHSRSILQARMDRILEDDGVRVACEETRADSQFHINERFEFVEQLVSMVADGVQVSAVLTGEGGLGKSFTVIKTLEKHGYVNRVDVIPVYEVFPAEGDKPAPEPKDITEEWINKNNIKVYISIKGNSTAKGLYRTLFENNGRIIVYDDCDAVLKDDKALCILKGALDSYGRRHIAWNADLKDLDLPRSFEFTGRVIFISNLAQNKIDQAIRSRSMMIDLCMTIEQKVQRMDFISYSPEFLPEYNWQVKRDAMQLITELQDDCRELSLRTLIAVCKIRFVNNDDWARLATYLLIA